MKALLYHDLLSLRRQTGWLWLLFAGALLFAASGRQEDIAQVIFSLLALLPWVTLMPETKPWRALCRSLPYSPRDLVLNKYVLLWLLSLAGAALTAVGTALLSPSALVVQTAWVSVLVSLTAALLLSALFFPLFFMYGFSSGGVLAAFPVLSFLLYWVVNFCLNLVRPAPLTVAAVLPVFLAALAANLASVPLAVGQYHREWRT